MRFKLDENVHPRCGELLAARDHDVATVVEENLGGADDAEVAERCLEEGRCLITADQDFAQIVDYPPEKYAGLIVLRHPRPTLQGMQTLIRQIVAAVAQHSPAGRLWIVEPGRLRVHESHGPDEAVE